MKQLHLVGKGLVQVEHVNEASILKGMVWVMCIYVLVFSIHVFDNILIDSRTAKENIDQIIPLHLFLDCIELTLHSTVIVDHQVLVHKFLGWISVCIPFFFKAICVRLHPNE